MPPRRRPPPPDSSDASGSESQRAGLESAGRRLIDNDTPMSDVQDDAGLSSSTLQPESSPARAPARSTSESRIQSSTTTAAASTTTPRPVPTTGQLQRLTSLRDSTPSGLTRGSAAGRLKFQPKNSGRRSKEAREAQETQERERLAARIEAAAAAARASGRGRGGTNIRGGAKVKDRRPGRSIQAASASGPFSASATFSAGTASSSRRKVTLSATGTAPRKLKSKSKSSSARAAALGSGDEGRVKSEHEDVIRVESSDDDSLDDDGGGRYNIETINIISSDEEEDEEDPVKPSRPKPKQTEWNVKPVRLGRREHQERTVDVSTEASAGTSAELRKRASDKHKKDSLFVASDDEAPVERKTKSRVRDKDVEVVRTWKGVYQDNEEEDDIVVKDEAVEEMMLDAVDPGPEASEQEIGSRPLQKKKKPLLKKKVKEERPVLQTEEDRVEWTRREEDLRVLIEELGFARGRGPAGDAENEDEQTQADHDDAEGDSRQGKLYFFQLPPVLPPLENQATTAETPIDITDAAVTNGETSGSAAGISGAASATAQSSKPKQLFPPGLVGKLKVHQSGKVSLSWGGMKMTVARGQSHEFLQNAVAIDHGRNSDVKEEDEEYSRDQQAPGKAWSFGEVTGRYVVVPDWEALLK